MPVFWRFVSGDQATMSTPRGQLPYDARFLRETGMAARIASTVEPVITDLGYRLVRVQMSGRDGQTLQIMAERADGTMSAGDCERVSHAVSPVLDVLDAIVGAFYLEVSSPGIDRPLVRPSDFEDWAGHEAKIELTEMVSGRKRFRGVIEGYEDGEVRVAAEITVKGQPTTTEVLGFPVELVAEARLVLTDELIRASLQRAKKAREARGDVADEAADDLADGADMPDDLEDVRPVPPKAN
jgi:ribosome maturation factor RimP